MKTKLLLISLIGLGLIAIITGVSGASFFTQPQVKGVLPTEADKNLRKTISKKVMEAKAAGKRDVIIPATSGDYITVANLEDAAAMFTTVIAEPIQVEGILVDEDETIGSWYRFRVIEMLSEPPQKKYPFTASAPTHMPSIGENEFVAYLSGGTVVLDGTEVKSYSNENPPLQLSNQYLLFLDFDKNSRVARLSLGPPSIFLIKPDGKLEAFNTKDGHYRHEMESRYRNSIGPFKAALKNR